MNFNMHANKWINELGLLNLVSKQHNIEKSTGSIDHKPVVAEPQKQTASAVEELVNSTENQFEKIDKSEFRLLVKMLHAINHECQYDHIEYNGTKVKYKLPSTTLVFHDIEIIDDDRTINLSSLADLLSNPNLKRPVWEKLKSIELGAKTNSKA